MDELKVLVVDDEDDFRELVVKRLINSSVVAEGAENGEKALKILEQKPFDVVLLDIKMPGIDGIETLRQIKACKPFVEVIMLTGHVSVEFGITVMKLGAFDYVVKPPLMNELLDKIRQAHEKKMDH